MNSLGALIKKKRKKISIRMAAGDMGIPWSTLANIENGKFTNPRFSNVMKICKYFDIDPWQVRL